MKQGRNKTKEKIKEDSAFRVSFLEIWIMHVIEDEYMKGEDEERNKVRETSRSALGSRDQMHTFRGEAASSQMLLRVLKSIYWMNKGDIDDSGRAELVE